MRIPHLLAAAVLAFAPALRAQDTLPLQPGVLFAAVDTMYTLERDGDTVAVAVQTLRRGTLDGAEVWEVEYRLEGSLGSMADTTFFDTLTLLPREQRRVGGPRPLRVRYDGGRIRVHRGPSPSGAPADSTDVDETPPVFSGSLMDLVYRALPLRTGYETRIGFFIPERRRVWTFTVRVEGSGVVETRDGPTEAWRVWATTEGREPEVFWIDRRTRALLRIDHPGGWSTIR